MSIVVVGANHRTAPLSLLERMAVPADQLPKQLHALDGAQDLGEVVMLATCNRTEVYFVAEKFHGAYQDVRNFFSDLTYLPPDEFADHLYVHHDEQAVQHLFDVATGLDSAVPGEHEILGQVRVAWDLARAEGTARRTLNLLFRHALEVGKRARNETGISQHVTSVSQAAVMMAGEHLSEATRADDVLLEAPCPGARAASGLAGRRVLVVGAGSMARGMASFVADVPVAQLVIANRTVARAEALASSLAERGGARTVRAAGLDELGALLADTDVLFIATDATDPVITRDMLAPAVRDRSEPLVAVDVGMPRDIAADCADLPGLELLDMEAVAALTEQSLAARHAEADAVRDIVAEEVGRFSQVVNAREVAPVVTALRGRAEQVRQGELERFAGRLEGLEPNQRDAVEALTKAILAKVLHTPTVQLKESAGTSRGDRLADTVRDLFDLG